MGSPRENSAADTFPAGSIVGYINEEGGAVGIEQTLNDQLKGADGERTFHWS